MVYLPYSWDSCPTLYASLNRLRNALLGVAGDSLCIIYFVPAVPSEFRNRHSISYHLWRYEPEPFEGFEFKFLTLKSGNVIKITPYGVSNAKLQQSRQNSKIYDNLQNQHRGEELAQFTPGI